MIKDRDDYQSYTTTKDMCEQDRNVGDVGVDAEAEEKDMEWKKRGIRGVTDCTCIAWLRAF